MSYFNHPKLALMTKTVNGGSFPPSLKIDFYNGNPQIFVLTGIKKGEGVTYIRAGIEPKTADILCEAIKYIADLPADPENNITATFECKSGKEKELTSKVVVGKNKSGSMFISVLDAKNTSAPMIQFFFGSDQYHPVSYKSVPGSEDPRALTSCLAAKGWAERVRAYWYQSLLQYEPENNKGSNNGGGYNKGGNNNYGSTKPVTDDDFDGVW